MCIEYFTSSSCPLSRVAYLNTVQQKPEPWIDELTEWLETYTRAEQERLSVSDFSFTIVRWLNLQSATDVMAFILRRILSNKLICRVYVRLYYQQIRAS